MKSFCLFLVAGIVAAVSFEPDAAGQTFFLERSGLQKQWRAMPAAFRSEFSGATTKKIIRSLSPEDVKQHVTTKQFNEQRVLRTPVSETVTRLPDEVTRITRNIDTHMPMVHERIRNHYAVENINKKNIIHHYVSPVRDERLGTRKGREFRQKTEHVVHKKAFDNLPVEGGLLETADLTGELLSGSMLDETQFGSKFWKVFETESCQCSQQGQFVRPKAVCCSASGEMLDDAECAGLPYPEDMMCNSC